MKLEFERRDLFPLICFILFFGINFLGYLLFPYEVLAEALYDNAWNYGITQGLSLISAVPLIAFFISLGYNVGVTRCGEKST